MSKRDPDLVITDVGVIDAPPMGRELEALLTNVEPVKTRRPWHAFLTAVLVGAAYAALWGLVKAPRFDLGVMPAWWVIGGATLWAAGWLSVLAFAMIPRRGQVILDGNRALVAAIVVTVVLALWNAITLWDPSAPGMPPQMLQNAWHCGRFAIVAWLVTMAGAWRGLRFVALTGAWRIGAAIGLAAGSLSGLLLHFVCPIDGAIHALVGHVGGALLSSLLGALLAEFTFGETRAS